MASKCLHRGCGKAFDDPEETCNYHRASSLMPSASKHAS